MTGIAPLVFRALTPTAMTVSGTGFGVSGAAVVRLTSAAGTPFATGTASFVDVPGVILNDTTITFTSPTAQVCPFANVGIGVKVTLPDTSEYTSAGDIATLSGAAISTFAPLTVPIGAAPSFTITGGGFGPLAGSVTVLFTASAGTPFNGGTSATASVPAIVNSSTSIGGTAPVATGGAGFTANVSVTFANGSCAAAVPGIVAFTSTVNQKPTLTTSVTGELTLVHGDHVSFTVTATDPDGDPVSLTLLDPPAGCTFAPVQNAASPKTATIDWVVSGWDAGGPVPLVFRSHDSVNPGVLSTLVVWTHLTPAANRTLRVGDVTGDGVADVVVCAHNADTGATNAGGIYVWAGATTPSGTPTATLTVQSPASGDTLASGGFRLADVTGDGTLDVVAASDAAKIASVVGAGAIYVWNGGSGLTGAKSPDATLTTNGGGQNKSLGSNLNRWQIGDVSGDGKDDIVAAAPAATIGATNTGALYLWKGGSALTGAKTPDAILVVTGGAFDDALGTNGLLLAELTGDSTLDVFSTSAGADGGGSSAGAMYLWKGGSGLTGSKAADAVMTITGPTSDDALGSQYRCEDVTGDGTKDVVAAVQTADIGGVADVGAIFVWNGGSSLTGAKTQDATLSVSGAIDSDNLAAGDKGPLQIGDVSGDGIADIVGIARLANVGGVADVGAAYLWKGGSGLTGSKTPDATMTVSGASTSDNLGRGGTRLADVTNDGVLDVVCSSPFAGTSDTGAVYVWGGGSGLAGAVAPTATLTVAGASTNDRLGNDPNTTHFTLRFADVSGDGALDLLVPGVEAGSNDEGALYVWNGGSSLSGSLSPSATLTVSGAQPGDKLGNSSGGVFVAAGDVTGDGVLDVVAAAASADIGGVPNVGGIYVWAGGSGLTGAKSPDATLKVTGAANGDLMGGGFNAGVSWDLIDLSGDGTQDVIGVACLASTGGLSACGAAYFWAGGSGMTGTPSPTATFKAPNATNADTLGRTGNVDLLVLSDVTGDGKVDLILGAPEYTGTGGPGAEGGVFLWKGGSGLTGTPTATTSFLVPGAVSLDRLGN